MCEAKQSVQPVERPKKDWKPKMQIHLEDQGKQPGKINSDIEWIVPRKSATKQPISSQNSTMVPTLNSYYCFPADDALHDCEASTSERGGDLIPFGSL